MTIKVTVPNTSSDSLTFGSANTPTAAQVVGIDSGSSNGQLAFNTTASGTSTERMRIDSSGNLGLGVTPSAWFTSNNLKALQFGGGSIVSYTNNQVWLASNYYLNSSGQDTYVGTGASNRLIMDGAYKFFTAASGTAGNAITFTQAMTLDSSGNLLVGTTSGSVNTFYNGGAEGSRVLNLSGSGQGCAYFYVTNGGGDNAAASAMYLKKNSSTNRSLNAAGTLNASGADYAEYMTKAGAFTIAKGDVVGINAEGKLTNVFAEAVSFCVKSTDPSYVGGDVWGNEEALGLTKPEQPSQRTATEKIEAETDAEFAVRQSQYETDKAVFETALEAARQTVDRIAFAGQVPVNVTGAIAGQYIVPVNDNGAIKGQAVSNPTFEQYQQAVGKVIAIEQDGRARIIVKVA
jgi:hypothetical protein